MRTSEKEDVKRKKDILSKALTVSFKAFSQKQTSEALGSAHHIPLTLYDGHSQLSQMLIKDKGNHSIIHIKPCIERNNICRLRRVYFCIFSLGEFQKILISK